MQDSRAAIRWPFWMLVFMSLVAFPLLADEVETSQEEETAAAMEFEKHYLVLLIRPDEPAEVDAEKAQKIQEEHLAHLSKLWFDGDALIAGPFEVPAEEKMRGMVIYRGDLELEEVRALAEADPAVKANRLEVQVLPWWHGDGLIQFSPPPDRGPEEASKPTGGDR